METEPQDTPPPREPGVSKNDAISQRVDGLLESAAKRMVAARWAVIGSVVLLALALGSQIPKLGADFTPSDLFASFEEQETISAEFQETFGNTDNVVLILVQAPDVLNQAALDYLHKATLNFKEADYVERADSITTVAIPRPQKKILLGGVMGMLMQSQAAAKRFKPLVSGESVTEAEVTELTEALSDAPLIEGKLVSKDRSIAAVVLFLKRELTRNEEIAAAVAKIKKWSQSNPPPEAVTTTLAGLPYVRAAVVDKMKADQTVMLPAAIIVSLLILLFTFRWFPAMVLPICAVLIAVVIVVGGMALVGESVNIVNNMVPILVLVIGVSNGIHLINRYGESYHEEPHRKSASATTLRYMAVACFLTSATTAIGFFSLGVSQTDLLRRFGWTAGIGVMVVYLVTILWLPAMLTVVSRPLRLAKASHEGNLESFLGRLTARLIKNRWAVIGVSTIIAALGLATASTLQVDNAVLDQLDPEDEVRVTARLIEDKLYGMRPLEVSFSAKEVGALKSPEMVNAMTQLATWAETQDGVLSTMSQADLLHEATYVQSGNKADRTKPFTEASGLASLYKLMEEAPRNPLAPYLNPEGTRARVNIQMRDMKSQAVIAFSTRLEAKITELFERFEDVEINLTGDAYMGSLGLDLVLQDLFWSVATAFLIIFGFLTLVLRDIRLGLLSVPPSMLPLLLTLGYIYVRGIPLNVATMIIFSVSIGLAVDGTIHILARFRQETQGGRGIEEALIRAARGTGKANILTYLALSLGFSVMLFSSFVPVRRFGELIAVTVLGCLAATIIVAPPLLAIAFRLKPKE